MFIFVLSAASCQNSDRRDVPSLPDNRVMAYPATDSTEHILEYEGFTSSYNHTTLIPNWVAYELTKEETYGDYKASSNFSRDPSLVGRQASREDYSCSGWDKGHMVPKADLKWSQKAWWQSHYFTNVCPQDHTLNGGDWNKLEQQVRRWARQYDSLFVVCGPIFTNEEHGTIGKARVHIPDAFFKAVLVHLPDGSYSAVAFVMENDDKRHGIADAAMSVDEIEKIINRDLFPALSDDIEEYVESFVDYKIWKLK